MTVARTVGFIHGFKNSGHGMMNCMIMMSKSMLSGNQSCFSFFASLLSFASSSKIQSNVTEKNVTDAIFITWKRFAFNVVLLRNLQ